MLRSVHQGSSWGTVTYFNFSYFSVSLLFFPPFYPGTKYDMENIQISNFNHSLSFLCFMMFWCLKIILWLGEDNTLRAGQFLEVAKSPAWICFLYAGSPIQSQTSSIWFLHSRRTSALNIPRLSARQLEITPPDPKQAKLFNLSNPKLFSQLWLVFPVASLTKAWTYSLLLLLLPGKWKSLSCVWLFATPWTVAGGILQARILEWVAFPGDLPNTRIEPRSPALQADSYWLSHKGRSET